MIIYADDNKKLKNFQAVIRQDYNFEDQNASHS